MKRILIPFILFFSFITTIKAQIVPDANGVVYVTTAGTGNGTSWSTSANLDDALVAAKTNAAINQIWIKGGNYQPKYDATGVVPGAALKRARTFYVRSNLRLYGSLAGNETSIGNNGNYAIATTDTTYFDGSDTSSNVVYLKNAGTSTLLNGIVVIRGKGTGANGGGLLNDGSNSGGSSTVSINNCAFRNNVAAGSGGAVANNGNNSGYAKIIFTNCTFVNNTVLGSSTGGAVASLGNNSGKAYATLANCTFVSNKAKSAGAIVNSANSGTADIRISNCQFKYNQTTGGAAGVILNAGQAGIANAGFTNCLFYASSASSPGGSIAQNDCSTNGNATLDVINCTIYGRSSSSAVSMFDHNNGGGGGTAVTNIYNDILWNGNGYVFSTASIYTQTATAFSSSFNIKNTIVQGVTPTAPFYNATIYSFYPLFIDSANGDMHLLVCSPAIEAGNNSLYSGTLSTDNDLAGGLRLINSNIDLGAYEAIYLAPLINKEPQSMVICLNNDTSFSVKASGDSLAYQWQTMKTTGGSFTNISGATHDTLRITADTSMNGWQFRCIVKNCLGADTSISATLNFAFQAPKIFRQPTNALTCYQTDTSFSVGVTGDMFVYQWQVKKLSGSFTDVINATHDTLSIVSADTLMNGWEYRFIAHNCMGADTSDVVTLTVKTGPIVVPFSSIGICSGDTLYLNVSSLSGTGVVYNWTGPNGFTAQVKDTIITSTNSTQAGLYRLVANNGYCDRTDSAMVTIDTPLVFSVIATSALCAGKMLQFDVSDTVSTNTYTWAGPAGFSSTMKSPVIPAASPSNSGTYTVSVHGKNSCKNSASKTITVSPLPPLGTLEKY